MDVGVVIFGTGGGAIGGMRIAAGSGGGAMDVVEIMATKKGRVPVSENKKDRVLRVWGSLHFLAPNRVTANQSKLNVITPLRTNSAVLQLFLSLLVFLQNPYFSS
jgi:hypothetical protein